jgi:hypothetical protein
VSPLKTPASKSRLPPPGESVRRLIGLPRRVHAADRLPDVFLSGRISPPAELLATLPLRPHTQNVLRRFLAAWPSTGVWTYLRLLSIPGFGMSALADLLERLPERRGVQTEPPSLRGTRLRRTVSPEGIWKALAVIADSLPASETEIHSRLIAAGLGPTPPTLADLERAARVVNPPTRFAVLRRPGLVLAVAPEQLPLAATVHSFALRLVRSSGVGDIRRVALRAGTGELGFVRAVVSARTGFRWVDAGRHRFDHSRPSSR